MIEARLDAHGAAVVAMPTRPEVRRDAPRFDYLIVGAGFAGSVLAERLARGSDKQVLLVDRRPHIAGNAYDHYNAAGVLIHRYGPHIFHTNSTRSRLPVAVHRVAALRAPGAGPVDEQLVPIPINLDTLERLYGLS